MADRLVSVDEEYDLPAVVRERLTDTLIAPAVTAEATTRADEDAALHARIDTVDNATYATVAPEPTGVAATDTAALQAVLDAAEDGDTIQLRPGTYALNAELTTTTRVHIIGQGGGGRLYHSTTLTFSPTTGVALTINADGSTLREVTFKHAAADPGTALGVRFAAGYYARLEDVTISGFNVNLDMVTGSEWRMHRCTIDNPKTYGLRIANTDHTDEGDMGIFDCSFICRDWSPDAAVYHLSGGGLRFVGNKINNDWRDLGGGSTAKDLEWKYGIYGYFTGGVQTSCWQITGNSIENFNTNGIFLVVGTGSQFYSVTITGNEFLGISYASADTRCINATTVDVNGIIGFAATGNVFNMNGGTNKPAVDLTRVRRVSISSSNVNSGFPWMTSLTQCTEVGEVGGPGNGFGIPRTIDSVAAVAATAQAWPSADRAYFWRVKEGGECNKLGLTVGTSSGNISLSIHRGVPGRNGPGMAKFSTGAIACPATGFQEVAMSQTVTINPGDWIGMSCDNTTATFRSQAPGLGDELWLTGIAGYQSASHPIPWDGSTPSVIARGDRVVAVVGIP